MHGEVVASDGVGVMLDGVDSDGSVCGRVGGGSACMVVAWCV